MSFVKVHKDLVVYQKAFAAAMEIYHLSKLFPKEETYSLTDQIRRSSRSVNANITVSLMGYPNWATNFTWSSTNVSEICIQGQSWTCISYNSFEVWDNEVEIKVAYQSPCGDWYEGS